MNGTSSRASHTSGMTESRSAIRAVGVDNIPSFHPSPTNDCNPDMSAASNIITIEVTTTEKVTEMFTVTMTIYAPGEHKEVSTAIDEGAAGQYVAGAEVKSDDLRSSWHGSGKSVFWAILAGVLGWVFIEVGHLLFQVKVKQMDTRVEIHRITTARRIEEKKAAAEIEVAKLEMQRPKMEEVKKHVVEK